MGAAAIICENRREEAAAGREASAVLEQLQAELAQKQALTMLAPTIPECPEYMSETTADTSTREQEKPVRTTREQMLGDPRALVVPDGTDVVEEA